MNRNKSEHGQAMIFIVLGFIIILGFVGMAIDGSMVYSDRRHAQNAADAASMAGGARAAYYMEDHIINYFNWNCGLTPAVLAQARQGAKDRAADNGFTIDEDASDFHGVEVDCEPGANYGGFVDKYIDVTVWITTVTPAHFSQFLFGGPLESRVQSVTRIRPRQPLAFGNAVVALNPANCSGHQNGVTFRGTPQMNVEGGGIFTNGCMRSVGTPQVNSPRSSYAGNLDGNASFDPPAQFVPMKMPSVMVTVSPPDCGHPDANPVTGAQLRNDSPLSAGLYCVSGDLRINAGDTFEGFGVTIYLLDGLVRINGGATIHLTAPAASPDPTPALPGILFYMASGNSNELHISGNSDSYFEGTIYAPESTIYMTGNENAEAFKTQLIGWNVEFGGTADTYVFFDQTKVFIKPTTMDLNR